MMNPPMKARQRNFFNESQSARTGESVRRGPALAVGGISVAISCWRNLELFADEADGAARDEPEIPSHATTGPLGGAKWPAVKHSPQN
jgi:hypothetical protein